MDRVNNKDQLLTFLAQRYHAHAAPGGSFCYAPGVPFFEDCLKELPRYRVAKTGIAANACWRSARLPMQPELRSDSRYPMTAATCTDTTINGIVAQ
jgi:hypothetical protein